MKAKGKEHPVNNQLTTLCLSDLILIATSAEDKGENAERERLRDFENRDVKKRCLF